jgi:RNA polymerase sigma factor (sigma-70 family)
MTRLAHRRVDVVAPLDPPDEEFWTAVRALPTRQAQCIALAYLEDRSAVEIAEVLAITPTTVRVHLHEARATLARQLRERAEDES